MLEKISAISGAKDQLKKQPNVISYSFIDPK